MKKYLLVLPLILFSCGPIDDALIIETLLSTEKIERIDIANKEVTVQFTLVLPNPCWRYAKSDITTNTTDSNIGIFGRYEGEPCAEVIAYLTRVEKITFSSSGVKTLHFWRNSGATLDTAIVIP